MGEFNENLKSGVFDVAKPVSCGLTLLALTAMRPVSSNSLDYIYAVIDKIKDTDSIDSLLTPSKVTALFLAAKENCLNHCVALLCAGANLQLVQSHPGVTSKIKNIGNIINK